MLYENERRNRRQLRDPCACRITYCVYSELKAKYLPIGPIVGWVPASNSEAGGRSLEGEHRQGDSGRLGSELPVVLSAGSDAQSHEASYLLSHHHLRRPSIAMSLRDSFSRLKKKLKHPLTGRKPKSDNTPAGTSNAATDEHKSNWKSTAFVSAILLLRGVRDSADAFGPLKSVAGGLCFILENCEV